MYANSPDALAELALITLSRWQREHMAAVNKKSSGTADDYNFKKDEK